MRKTRICRAAVVAAMSAMLLTISQGPASAAPSGWKHLDNFRTGQDVFISDGRGVTLSRISVPPHLFAFNQKEGGYYEIVQNDAQLTILYESFHEVRRIALDGRGYPEELPHRSMG